MKTAVIRYRVADFLKTYPPFDALPEQDLMELAGSGRVSFHQGHEYVFRKGQRRGNIVWVIQQGRVELLDESVEPESLHDVLGEGDLLGAGPFVDEQAHSQSARTASDVILYSIDAEGFDGLVKKHPAMARYLAAHSIGNREMRSSRSSWLDTEAPSMDALRSRLVVCDPSLSVKEAAIRLQSSGNEAIAVVDAAGKALGLLSAREFSDRVATGWVPLDASCEAVMTACVPSTAPGLSTWDYLLCMMRGRSEALFVADEAGALEGILHESDLALLCGRNPAALVREFLRAKTMADLVRVRRHAGAMIGDALGTPATIESWLEMATEFHILCLEALIRFAEAELAAEGTARPDVPYCWMTFGSGGRGETFALSHVELGLVFGGAADGAAGYFVSVAGKVLDQLVELGFVSSPEVAVFGLSEWEEKYRAWITDPILSSIYLGRSMLDFRPITGDRHLLKKLTSCIETSLHESEIFIPVLANDTICNLPPMSFFRGVVIELDGAESRTLDMKRSALDPVADAARVFALATGYVSSCNTLDRLDAAAKALPKNMQMFRDAADAFRIVLYEHAMAVLRTGDSGGQVNPAALNRYDQRLLKTAFQSIHHFLEFTAGTYTSMEER